MKLWDSLRAWWYARRRQAAYAVLPTAELLPFEVKPPHAHQTPADRLDWLAVKHRGHYAIRRPGDGAVILFVQGDEVISSGLRPNLAVAVQALYDRLEP